MRPTPKSSRAHRPGVTLIELLVTLIVSVIVVLTMTVPFMAERLFWGTGKRQTEAQRDAHLGMRAIARAARESKTFAGTTFTRPSGCTITFTNVSGQLRIQDTCRAVDDLIIRSPSEITAFSMTLVAGTTNRVLSLPFPWPNLSPPS